MISCQDPKHFGCVLLFIDPLTKNLLNIASVLGVSGDAEQDGCVATELLHQPK